MSVWEHFSPFGILVLVILLLVGLYFIAGNFKAEPPVISDYDSCIRGCAGIDYVASYYLDCQKNCEKIELNCEVPKTGR